jgi:hypothetical protein
MIKRCGIRFELSSKNHEIKMERRNRIAKKEIDD